MSMRRMQIAGRIGQDPDIRQLNDGTVVADLSVATELYRDDETVWVSVAVFGTKAEFVRDYLSKGDCVTAVGRPEIDTWEGSNGINAEFQLYADELEPLGSSGGSQDSPAPDPENANSGDDEPFDDEEIPF